MAFTKPEQIDRARELRKRETAAEIKLWESLRGRRLSGLKFVRQLPVGAYVADFVCRECKLVIEVDGATHSSDEELAYDMRRTAYLEGQGYKILRVWNLDVFKNLDGVLETVLRAAGKL